jgi:hypothetical protein
MKKTDPLIDSAEYLEHSWGTYMYKLGERVPA